MNWRQKAAVQNLVGRLPPALGNPVYYWLQSTFGGLRHPTPMSRLKGGVRMAQRICDSGHAVTAKAFLEIGTGHQLNLPLSLWLCGAGAITTVDLNRYLRPKLVLNDLKYLRRHEREARDLFRGLPEAAAFDDRFERLLACASFEELLTTTRIRYLAPTDAARLDLRAQSIDYHVSFTVLEHIPAGCLTGIFAEGRRLLKPDGLFVHCVDFTDHFAHTDASISSVNFLRFSEDEWRELAGNRFMFHNRLRVDEFEALARRAELDILSLEARVDAGAVEAVKNGLVLDARFRAKDPAINATTGAWLVAAPRSREPQQQHQDSDYQTHDPFEARSV